MRITVNEMNMNPGSSPHEKLWLARGAETGSIYLMLNSSQGLCIVGKGGMAEGEMASSGGFVPLRRGSVVTIEV